MFVSIDIGTAHPIIYNIECMFSNLMDFMSKDVKVQAQNLIQEKVQEFSSIIQTMKESILINESKIRAINMSNRTKNKVEKNLQMELKRLKIKNYDQIHLLERDTYANLTEEIGSLRADIDIYTRKIKSRSLSIDSKI